MVAAIGTTKIKRAIGKKGEPIPDRIIGGPQGRLE
jgi:hypothetical protein